MNRRIVRLVDRAFAGIGLELRRRPAAAPPAPIVPGVEACLALSRAGGGAAFECPLARCVAYNGFRYGGDGWHPFVAELEAHAAGESETFDGSPLERFYERWRPADALEAMIGGSEPDSPRLRRLPSYAFLFPWSAVTPAERLEAVRGIVRSENRHHAKLDLPISAGYNQHGPVHPRKGAIEHARLVACYRSLARDGWDRRKGDAAVTVLRRGSDVRFLVLHGHHRAAAANALGLGTIPARVGVPPEARRDEAAHWPQVTRGVWDREGAEAYLDHLFDFDSREWAIRRGIVNDAEVAR